MSDPVGVIICQNEPSAADRKMLRSVGYVCIVGDPKDFRIVLPPTDKGVILDAAMQAIKASSVTSETFGRRLCGNILKETS